MAADKFPSVDLILTGIFKGAIKYFRHTKKSIYISFSAHMWDEDSKCFVGFEWAFFFFNLQGVGLLPRTPPCSLPCWREWLIEQDEPHAGTDDVLQKLTRPRSCLSFVVTNRLCSHSECHWTLWKRRRAKNSHVNLVKSASPCSLKIMMHRQCLSLSGACLLSSTAIFTGAVRGGGRFLLSNLKLIVEQYANRTLSVTLFMNSKSHS